MALDDYEFGKISLHKLSDTLPISTLKHCLGVVKEQHMTASQLAEIADGYESNFLLMANTKVYW